MTFLKRYLIPRLIQYVLVIWLGITAVFPDLRVCCPPTP